MNQKSPGSSSVYPSTAKCHSTPRLDTLVSMARPSHVLADIGCDHAYLPILLIRSGAASHVIASDISDGPLAKAERNVARFGLEGRIELRKGNGLAALRPGEADCIVVAGMGGNVIAEILKTGHLTAQRADKLLLQPMSASEHLRVFLYENGYAITQETLVQEGRRYYTILEVKTRSTERFQNFDCFFSPALFASNQNGLLDGYLKKRRRELCSVIVGMEQAHKQYSELTFLRGVVDELDKRIGLCKHRSNEI